MDITSSVNDVSVGLYNDIHYTSNVPYGRMRAVFEEHVLANGRRPKYYSSHEVILFHNGRRVNLLPYNYVVAVALAFKNRMSFTRTSFSCQVTFEIRLSNGMLTTCSFVVSSPRSRRVYETEMGLQLEKMQELMFTEGSASGVNIVNEDEFLQWKVIHCYIRLINM
jgi:hypothetical protein